MSFRLHTAGSAHCLRGFAPMPGLSLDHLMCRLFRPVDVASLALFRIAFGSMLLWHLAQDALSGGVTAWYVTPQFFFKYYGLEWVRPWPGAGMYLHFVATGFLAACVMLGLCYRLACTLLCVGYTYIFLLEQTYYLNHEYLICLLCLVMVFVPAHRAASFDRMNKPQLRSNTVPVWSLWLLRVQIGIPYLYGGLAKFDGDWLSGIPVRLGLQERTDFPLIGPILGHEATVWVIVYGGLLFDLTVVPLLLCRRTRLLGFGLAVLFHLSNAMLFDIGIFPWLMISATTLFFEPDWPRRVAHLTGLRGDSALHKDDSRPRPDISVCPPWTNRQRLTFVLLVGYLAVQCLVPLRHHLYPGNASWTEEGHRFSWRMMLAHKRGAVRFEAVDSRTGERWPLDVAPMLTQWQRRRAALDPDTILQLAHHLALELRAAEGRSFEIRVRALVSLNGRRPQLLIDPEIDLASQPRTLRPKPWILPLTEPLRDPPWNRPVREWFESADVAGEQTELPPQRRG